VPEPPDLGSYVKDRRLPSPRQGFFWTCRPAARDLACASCHFQRASTTEPQHPRPGSQGPSRRAVHAQLRIGQFPFHVLADQRPVLACALRQRRHRRFAGLVKANFGGIVLGDPVEPDVSPIRLQRERRERRQVMTRNSRACINASLMFRISWDGSSTTSSTARPASGPRDPNGKDSRR